MFILSRVAAVLAVPFIVAFVNGFIDELFSKRSKFDDIDLKTLDTGALLNLRHELLREVEKRFDIVTLPADIQDEWSDELESEVTAANEMWQAIEDEFIRRRDESTH